MEIKDLKRLLDAAAETGVSEITLETGEYKLTVKRGVTEAVAAQPAAAPALAQSAPAPQEAVAPAQEAPQAAPEPSSTLVEVTAPIVGTFYASSAPDAPPYVKVGDRVEQGQILCIIEAMKLMNEIEAETAGRVAEVLVKNEDPVEYGQVLFRIEPA